MKLSTLLLSGLIACSLVICSSKVKKSAAARNKDNEMVLKLLLAIGPFSSPEERLKAYKDSNLKPEDRTILLNILGFVEEKELEDAVALGVENIMSIYLPDKESLKELAKKERLAKEAKEQEQRNRRILEAQREAEITSILDVLRKDREILLNNLFKALKETKTGDDRVQVFSKYLENIKKKEVELLLLGLNVNALQEECRRSIKWLRKALRSNSLQPRLKKIAEEILIRVKAKEAQTPEEKLLHKRKSLLKELFAKVCHIDSPKDRVNAFIEFLQALDVEQWNLLLLDLDIRVLSDKCAKDVIDFKKTLKNIDVRLKLEQMTKRINSPPPPQPDTTARSSKPKLPPTGTTKTDPFFTSYLAIAIYCFIGIIMVFVVYFVFIKDTEEEFDL